MKLSAEVQITVPFCDVDAMGIVWHGNYFRYFEQARSALLGRIDYDYLAMHASGYHWPIVDAAVRYVQPARIGQTVRVTAALEEYEVRLRIGYEVFDAQSGQRLTRGHTVQVAVHRDSGELCLASPRALLDRLERA